MLRKQLQYLLASSVFALLLILPLLTVSVGGEERCTEDIKEVKGIGEADFGEDTTKAVARSQAINNARRNALEKVGVLVRSFTGIYDDTYIHDFVTSTTRGIILKQDLTDHGVVKEATTITPGAREMPRDIYRVEIKAEVKVLCVERKGDFKIEKVTLHIAGDPKPMKIPAELRENEEVQIRVTVNEDAFVSIFNVDQTGRVSQLFPNPFVSQEHLRSGQELIFPSDAQRTMGLHLRVRTPEKLSQAVESNIVIATRKELIFFKGGSEEEPLMLTDLLARLAELDISSWAEATVGYKVMKIKK